MASLSYLQPYVDEVHARAEELDVPTPVVDALRDNLRGKSHPIIYSQYIDEPQS